MFAFPFQSPERTFNFQPTPPKKHFSLAGTGQKGTLATRSQPFEGDFSPFPFPAALKRGLSVFRFQLQPVRFSRLSAVSGRGISISTLGNGSENGSGPARRGASKKPARARLACFSSCFAGRVAQTLLKCDKTLKIMATKANLN